jgi:hypothetical protein
MAACQLYRNENNEIDKVLAPNLKESTLYKDILAEVTKKGPKTYIEGVPYIRKVLDEGLILDESIEEVAVGLWSMFYSPNVYNYLNNANENLAGMYFDANGEIKFTLFKQFVLDQDVLSKKAEPTYVLESNKQDAVDSQKKRGNKLQQGIVKAIIEDPENPVILEPVSHTYIDAEGEVYTSTTTAIKGVLNDDGKYEFNRAIGNGFDALMDNIIQGKSFKEATEGIDNISPEILKYAYNIFSVYINGLKRDGSLVFSQVVVADPISRRAGTIDLLVVSPNGRVRIIDLKSSKNSVLDTTKYDKKYQVKANEDPNGVNSVFVGEDLSTREQHGIQVGAYAKMIELMGFPVESVETLHLRYELSSDNTLTGFTWEGETKHPLRANKAKVDRVVPTPVTNQNKTDELKKALGMDNPAMDKDFLSAEDSGQEDPELVGDMYEKMYKQVIETADLLKARKAYLEKLSKAKSFEDKDVVIDKINELLIMLQDELMEDRPSQAYGKFLRYAMAEMTEYFKRITDPAELNSPTYVDMLLQVRKNVESYRGIMKIKNRGSKEQQRMHDDLVETLNDVFDTINTKLEDYVKNLVKSTTSKDLTEDDLNGIVKAAYDINALDTYLGDMSTSTDVLLSIVDKIYKRATNKVKDRIDEINEQLRMLGNALLKASGKTAVDKNFYDFMKVLDKNGNWTTRYVQKIGRQYFDKYWEIQNKLTDNKGERKKYIPIESVEGANPEDIAYNKELWALKQKMREFKNAETLSSAGAEDGDYHKYSDEFKQARNKVMELVAVENDEGEITSYIWERREDVTDSEFNAYQLKYFNKVEYWGAVYNEGVFTGAVRKTDGYFVKNEFVEIRDVASTGEDMRDEKWVKLQNPQTLLEKAQSEFYNRFMELKAELDSKLPPEVASSMKGKAGRVKADFQNLVTKQGASFSNLVFKSIRDYFSADVSSDQRLVDETGVIDSGIPILFVGKTQNEYLVNRIKTQISELEQERAAGKITQKVYLDKKKELKRNLQFEESRVKTSEVEADLVKNMMAYAAMAENYDIMSSIEGSLKAIQEVVENRQYYKVDDAGNVLIQKGSRETRDDEGKRIFKKADEVNTKKRLDKWFSMVFYNNDEFNRTQLAMIAKRIQNFTSLKGIGFNVFGNINNYVMARINNAIEAAGGQYYERDAATRAMMEYNKDYLPGVFTGLGSSNGEYYKEKQPNSKYEAMVEYFRMVKKYQEDQGKVDVMSWPYLLQEGGEYNAQSKTGIAVLMSRQLTNKNTGETVSMYDAYDWDPNSKELKLKDGFELSDEQRYDTTNYILEVNKQIHGNYAWEDRMVIQEHWLGQLAAQFHKWVYPAYKARFKKAYDDENLGVVEGRYRSVYNLLAYIKESEGGLLEMIEGGWDKMSDVQRKNMLKVAAELAFLAASYAMYGIFRSLAEGVDDDDETLKKWMNFMAYQGSRQMNEITTLMPIVGFEEQYQLAKSPIPILNQLKEFSQAVKSTMSLPFPPYDKNYYERGIHKGELKAWKEWKDVTPAFAILNKWDSFEQVRSFYIR